MKKKILHVIMMFLLLGCNNKNSGKMVVLPTDTPSVLKTYDIAEYQKAGIDTKAFVIHLKGKQKLKSWAATGQGWVYFELLEDSSDTRAITLLRR